MWYSSWLFSVAMLLEALLVKADKSVARPLALEDDKALVWLWL